MTTSSRPTVYSIVYRYWEQYGRHLHSAGTVKTVVGLLREHALQTMVKDFGPVAQELFIASVGPLSPGTAKRYLGVIHAALAWAQQREEVVTVPVKLKVKGQDGEGVKPFTIQELRYLMKAATTVEEQRFMLLAVATAARPGAVMDLSFYQVDHEFKVINLQPSNREITKKQRPTVPIGAIPNKYLCNQIGAAQVCIVGGRMFAQDYRAMFYDIVTRAGLQGTAYGIRKAVAMWLRRSGVPEVELKGFLGHSLGVTDRYAYLDPHYMQATKNAIDALLVEVCPPWLEPYLPVQNQQDRSAA